MPVNFQRVYSVIKASSSSGSVVASSDRLTILPVDEPLAGFTVGDGSRCTTTGIFHLTAFRCVIGKCTN